LRCRGIFVKKAWKHRCCPWLAATTMLWLYNNDALHNNESIVVVKWDGPYCTYFFLKLRQKTAKKTFFHNFCPKIRYFEDFSFSQFFSKLKSHFFINDADHIAPIFFSNWGKKQQKKLFFITFAPKLGILKIFHFLNFFQS